MLKKILLVIIIFSFQSVYSQKRNEVQTYTYEDKPLSIEIKTNHYRIFKSDTIEISLKFVNHSNDTLLIHPFREIKLVSENLLGFNIVFSRFAEGGEDWPDTLLILDKQSELNFYFKVPTKEFFTGREDYSHFFVTAFLDVGFVSSIDTLRKYLHKEKIYFRKEKLIVPHSTLEVSSERRQFKPFTYYIENFR